MIDWCILQCSPGSTIALAAALATDGIAAWTPVVTQFRRVGRKRVEAEVQCPITPTFVFADHDRIDDLVRLSEAPSLSYRKWDAVQRRMVMIGRPRFHIFRVDGHVARIPDRQLEPLREFEVYASERALLRRRRGPKKATAPVFAVGEAVTAPDGPFAGMTGRVVATRDGKFVMVSFPTFPLDIAISAWLLQRADVDSGGAALAA